MHHDDNVVVVLPALDPDTRAAQKERFGCEFLPNVTEAGSGLMFAELFQNERDGSRKGIVVMELRERS